MEIRELEGIVRSSGYALANHLAAFWPTSDARHQPEANLVMQLGIALSGAGFWVYPEFALSEASGAGKPPSFDLVALKDGEPETWLVAEGKRIYTPTKGFDGIKSELERMVKLASIAKSRRDKQIKDRGEQLARNSRTFAAFVATTWCEDIATWWTTDLPDEVRSRWEKLMSTNKELHDLVMKGHWGSFAFSQREHTDNTGFHYHHFVYVLFEVTDTVAIARKK